MRNALSWHQMPTRGSGRVLPVSLVPAEGRMQIKNINKRGGVLFFSKGIKKKAPDAGTKCPLVGLAGLSSPRHWCQLQAANKQLCVALKPNSYHQGND